jgi:hypothetical protein
MLNMRGTIGFKAGRDSEVAEDVPNVAAVSPQKLSAWLEELHLQNST